MKRLPLLGILVLFSSLFLIFFGCRKFSDSAEESKHIKASTVSVIKEWLKNESLKLNVNQKKFVDSIFAYAVWETAIQRSASNGKQLIYVPLGTRGVGLELFCDEKAAVVDSGNIVKINDRNSKGHMSHFFAIKTYYESVVLKMASPTQFSGQITAYSLKNKFRYSYKFVEGTIFSMAFHAPVKSQQATIKTNSVIGPKPNGETCDLMGLFAYYPDRVVLVATWYECTSDPGDSGPAPIAPGCLPPSEASIGISTGQPYVHSVRTNDCQEPAGGTPAMPVVRVWNNITRECLKRLLDKVTSHVNDVTSKLAEQFAPSSKNAFNFMELPMANHLDGGYDGYVTVGNLSHYNIFLNANLIPYVSQEYAAATILHEALHAWIDSHGLNTSGAVDHAYIGDYYVKKIADALKSMFPDIPYQHAMALAWAGTESEFSAAYAQIPSHIKSQYATDNLRYRKTDGTSLGTNAPISGNCPN